MVGHGGRCLGLGLDNEHRYLSADPLIDGPASTQGWNRYSYVHGNPLSFTDPSGFCIDKKKGCDWKDGPGHDGSVLEEVLVTGNRGSNANMSSFAAAMHGSAMRSIGGDLGGGGGSGPGLDVIEEVVTTASRIGFGLSMPSLAASDSTTDGAVDWCAIAEALAQEDAAPIRSDNDMLDAVDAELTLLGGAATAAASSTQGDAFVRMTSAAYDASALAPRGISTMAEQFGPLARGLAVAGWGVNLFQIAIGHQRAGMSGATFASIDAGVTNVSARLGPAGIAYALAFNLTGGSQAMHQAQGHLGRIERMNSAGTLCAAARRK